MSSFFDKKEEVMEIELTQYGKHLLSKGEFSPAYYSFFDDDVTYDWKYTGDATEEPNYSEERLLSDTPNARVQYVFSGRDREMLETVNHVRNNRKRLNDKKIQQTPEKHYALSAPLGNSSYDTSLAPSWSAAALLGKFSEIVRYQQGSQPTLKIPQINIEDARLLTRTVQGDSHSGEQWNTLDVAGDPFAAGEASGNLGLQTVMFDDGSHLEYMESGDILLEISESNTECIRENFDIEIFLIEEEDTSGNVTTPGLPAAKQNKVERLVPLRFGKRFSNVVNGVLTDETPPEKIYAYDSTFVEHFLEISVDKEINKAILCKASVRSDATKCGGFSPDFLDCEDRDNQLGLYNKTSNGPYGDNC